MVTPLAIISSQGVFLLLQIEWNLQGPKVTIFWISWAKSKTGHHPGLRPSGKTEPQHRTVSTQGCITKSKKTKLRIHIQHSSMGQLSWSLWKKWFGGHMAVSWKSVPHLGLQRPGQFCYVLRKCWGLTKDGLGSNQKYMWTKGFAQLLLPHSWEWRNAIFLTKKTKQIYDWWPYTCPLT